MTNALLLAIPLAVIVGMFWRETRMYRRQQDRTRQAFEAAVERNARVIPFPEREAHSALYPPARLITVAPINRPRVNGGDPEDAA